MKEMSAEQIRNHIKLIQHEMGNSNSYIYFGRLTNHFLCHINQLQQMHGEFIGRAKSKHPEYINQLSSLGEEVTNYFDTLSLAISREVAPASCCAFVNSAIGKISEIVSFTEALDLAPISETVSKSAYDKLLLEKEELKKTIGIMVQYKGLPELNTLLETAKNYSLSLDEYWVLALCSANLIEAVVNRKLEKLGEKAEGNFEERYKKLCKAIKEKEGRDIHQLLPSAVYKVRNKLDHQSDSNRVTPREAKDISKLVIDFMIDVFQ